MIQPTSMTNFSTCYGLIPGVVPELETDENIPVAQDGHTPHLRAVASVSGNPEETSTTLREIGEDKIKASSSWMEKLHQENDIPTSEKSIKEIMEQLNEHFKGGMSFFSGEAVITRETRNIVLFVADILKQHQEQAIMIKGYTAKPSGNWQTHSKCVELARRRACSVQEALYQAGCLNKIVTVGLGYADNLGPRCEIIPCSFEHAQQKEDEIQKKGEAVEQVEDETTIWVKGEELEQTRSLQIEFECDDGVRAVTFSKTPWGICFDLSIPCIVTFVEPDSHADDLGVKIGWVFKTIAGQDVTGIDIDTMLFIMQDAAAVLPQT